MTHVLCHISKTIATFFEIVAFSVKKNSNYVTVV
jgi:hypothetical protein